MTERCILRMSCGLNDHCYCWNRLVWIGMPIQLANAECELFAACERMGLNSDSALYVVLEEYKRMKQVENPDWTEPKVLDS